MSQRATTSQFYLRERGKIIGRYTVESLLDMKNEGRLSRFSRLSRDKRTWVSTEEILSNHVHQVEEANKPPEPPPRPAPEFSVLKPFPIIVLMMLHFPTAGLFTFFWITSMHGRLPKLEPHHPSGWKAILMGMVPFVNLYWFFFCYPWLAERLNHLQQRYGIHNSIPIPLITTACAFTAFATLMSFVGGVVLILLSMKGSPIGEAAFLFLLLPNILTTVNYLFLVPVIAVMFQKSYNLIGQAQMDSLLSTTK